MPLLQLESAVLTYGERHLLDNAALSIDEGARLGLIGRNGEGKSTLLKVLHGELVLDSGRIIRHRDLRIARLEQVLPAADERSVDEFIAEGLGTLRSEVRRFAQLSADNPDAEGLLQLQQRIESVQGWDVEQRLDRQLADFGFERGRLMSSYSGGWRRKAALARALISRPELLLLDEPTNHLDIGQIEWLEGFLRAYAGAVILITHDRAFLRAVATQILELDRGRLLHWKGNYDSFLVHKEQLLASEAKDNALFDKRLAEEEAWIRQGIKARRTRNEGRVRALEKMRVERARRREVRSLGSIDIAAAGRSGKLVAELDEVGFGYDGNAVIRDFSCTIWRGDKIGLIGPNGVGKSTLLKLIVGDLEAQSGSIRRGSNISHAYFDQLQAALDPDKSVLDNVAEGRDSVQIGERQTHVLSWLQDFLFSPQQARAPVRSLSGGERSRVMLAKLFCQSSNLLILDEPTNDLDTDTLELLESLLVDYRGTVLLVSHDREFLDNVVTSTIAFEGEGRLTEYVGGYRDWLRQSRAGSATNAAEPDENRIDKKAGLKVGQRGRKLSYSLQRELDSLPQKLEQQEERVAELHREVCAEDFYLQADAEVKQKLAQVEAAEQRLREMFERWEELDALSSNPDS